MIATAASLARTSPVVTRARTAADQVLAQVLQYAARHGDQLARTAAFAVDDYTRTCVMQNDQLELWLLGWRAGQRSTIHDHAALPNACVVLTGELRAQMFTPTGDGLVTPGATEFQPMGHASADMGGAVHRVTAVSARAVSLHAFAPRFVAGRTFTLACP